MTARRGRRSGAKVKAREGVEFTPGLGEALVALVTYTALMETDTLGLALNGDDESRDAALSVALDAGMGVIQRAEPGGLSLALLIARAVAHVRKIEPKIIVTAADLWDTIVAIAHFGRSNPLEAGKAQIRATQLLISRIRQSATVRGIEALDQPFRNLMATTLPVRQPEPEIAQEAASTA